MENIINIDFTYITKCCILRDSVRETWFSQKSKRFELDLSRIVIKNGGKHGKGSCRSQLGR